MINVLVLSNNHNELITLSDNIRRCDKTSMCILTTNDPQEAIAFIKDQAIIFDVFVVNMRLRASSGYTFEKCVRKIPLYKYTPFIFLTKNEQDLDHYPFLSTFESYKTRSFAKMPLDPLELQSKFCLYLDYIFAKKIENNRNNQVLVLRRGKDTLEIRLRDIRYMEIQNKVCTIYSSQGKFFVRRISLSSLLKELACKDLIRCHRYYAINVTAIDYIERRNSKQLVAYFKEGRLTCPVSNLYLSDIVDQITVQVK